MRLSDSQSEQVVIAGILNFGFDGFGGKIPGEDLFTDLRHRLIFRAAESLNRDGIPVDLLSVTRRLADTGDLQKAGDSPYLTELLAVSCFGTFVETAMAELQSCRDRRTVHDAAKNLLIDLEHGAEPRAVLNGIASVLPPPEPQFSEPEAPLAPFPVDALGGTLEAMGRAICDTEGVPESLAGCCMLGIVSAAIGSKLEVVSGSNRTTRGNLFILASAESGSGKSATFRNAAEPFQRIESDFLKTWQKHELPRLMAEKDLIESEIGQLKKPKAKGGDTLPNEERINELQKLNQRLGEIEAELQSPAMSCEDTTTEKLASLLASNDEQLASLSADARGVLDNILGRYTKGRATDEALYLKGYTGEPHRVDRLSRGAIVLQKPCLTVLWLTQPDKLEVLLGTESLSEGGLLPRFLICHTGAEPQEIGECRPVIPATVQADYDQLIKTLVRTFRCSDCAATVKATSSAMNLLNGHHNEIVRRQKGDGDLRDVKSFAARWTENAWRVAVCLHAAEHGIDATPNDLNNETAQRAIRIVNWFSEQQLDVLSAGRMAAKKSKTDRVLELLSQHPEGITNRLVQRARIEPTAEAAKVLLATMESDGILIGQDCKPDGGGKESRIYRGRKP